MKNATSVTLVIWGLVLALFASCAPNQTIKNNSKMTEVSSFPFTQTVNGVTVEFSGYERKGAYLTANVCFGPPNSDEWLLDDVVLIAENQEIPHTGITSQRRSNRADGFLCGNASFPVGVSPSLGKIELVIGRLQTAVDKYDCQKAQRKLDEANTGIVVTCDMSSFEGKIPSFGGNISGYAIKQKPNGMSGDEALDLAKDAFTDIIQGPWRFSFVAEKP